MSNQITLETLHSIVSYHSCDDLQIAQIANLRDGAEAFMKIILSECLPSADRTEALRCVRTALLWSNANIALGPERI